MTLDKKSLDPNTPYTIYNAEEMGTNPLKFIHTLVNSGRIQINETIVYIRSRSNFHHVGQISSLHQNTVNLRTDPNTELTFTSEMISEFGIPASPELGNIPANALPPQLKPLTSATQKLVDDQVPILQ
jgi:hypothetical protein